MWGHSGAIQAIKPKPSSPSRHQAGFPGVSWPDQGIDCALAELADKIGWIDGRAVLQHFEVHVGG
jgi:hypothetical protein